MPFVEVTKDQFVWEAETLVHTPSGARFNASTGGVDRGMGKAQLNGDFFDPVDVGFVAGQLLADRSKRNPREISADHPDNGPPMVVAFGADPEDLHDHETEARATGEAEQQAAASAAVRAHPGRAEGSSPG